ncbi:MAG: helix-turn-helix domain-containing protein [Actinomyces ruminicola]|uniref:Transcriptional regulator, AraC family with amidase-like domain n=1 Tax=Actinomyces ruminicola TaxID=332524 RepID=A0A1G9S5T3_9ACTO|nr:helix-turn-helix domain-containing protein [Actinomyces ruminicola]MBE6482029.1 helix-turn-helix domain-containing protein [Actinomyces ruminicola]SDM30836.1 transcriptional regulator, AraC family with amidase-like domain [Actinomyces ruminicola]
MRIAIYAFDGASMFHLASPQMVFGTVSRLGLADWRPLLFTDASGPVHTLEGYELGGLSDLTCAAQADVVVVPSWHDDGCPAGTGVVNMLRHAHARGATILGLCLGAFPVAEAGLLDGRRAVTHWRAMNEFTRLYPTVIADESALYVDHGDVLTSAGTASAIDACLHFVRSRLGARAANSVARTMVVAPHREGGQAQYVEQPLPSDPGDDAVARLMEWVSTHLDEDLSVQRLAEVAHLSARTLIRRFRTATGSTPAAWVRSRRVDAARTLLEGSALPIERVAEECGFGSVVTMRQAFSRVTGTSPSAYRRNFRAD